MQPDREPLNQEEPMSSAVKLSGPLVAAARAESKLAARSMTQQIEHWARIGRAVERSGVLDRRDLRRALAAELDFDSLKAEERAAALGVLEEFAYSRDGDPQLAEMLAAEPAFPTE